MRCEKYTHSAVIFMYIGGKESTVISCLQLTIGIVDPMLNATGLVNSLCGQCFSAIMTYETRFQQLLEFFTAFLVLWSQRDCLVCLQLMLWFVLISVERVTHRGLSYWDSEGTMAFTAGGRHNHGNGMEPCLEAVTWVVYINYRVMLNDKWTSSHFTVNRALTMVWKL